MIKIETKKVDEFINLLEALKPVITTDITLNLAKDFLTIKSWDTAHTAIVNVEIGNEFFDGYIIDDDVSLSFMFGDFLKFVKSFKKFKEILIEDYGTGIRIFAQKGNTRKKVIIPTVVPDFEDEVPDLSLDWKFIVHFSSKDLKDGVKDASLALEEKEEDIIFQKEGEIFRIEARNKTKGSVSTREWNVATDMIALVSEDAKSLFSKKMLEPMVVAGEKLAKKVQISLGNDLPLELKYVFPNGVLTYYLAPLIE